jgi:Immunoglobulin I-set domain
LILPSDSESFHRFHLSSCSPLYFKVSWMRKRDLHILTSNNFLYTGDQRFSVVHPQDTDEWNLKIEYAQPKDAGTYECQVGFSFVGVCVRGACSTPSRGEKHVSIEQSASA